MFIANISAIGLCKEREEVKNYPVNHSSVKNTKLSLVLGNRKQSFSTGSFYRTKDEALSDKNRSAEGVILDNRVEFEPEKNNRRWLERFTFCLCKCTFHR